MLLNRREFPVLIFNLIYVPVFTVIALRNLNFEFILYVGVILVVGAWVVVKQRSIQFPPAVLWGLSVWGLLHMAGGNLRVGEDVLYGLQLIPIVLRYDQLVHAFGFGTATLLCCHLLHRYLKHPVEGWGTLSFLIVMMGCGLGAMNEIVEFIAVKSFENTNVGGYDNTLWDLIFNLVGAVAATTYLAWTRKAVARRRTSERSEEENA